VVCARADERAFIAIDVIEEHWEAIDPVIGNTSVRLEDVDVACDAL
jgi:hypothetical protein